MVIWYIIYNQKEGGNMKQDTLNLKEWAKEQSLKMVAEIKYYILSGIEKEAAVKMVFDTSCIGAGYKAQIRYEVKSL